jgi:hypothetical protein
VLVHEAIRSPRPDVGIRSTPSATLRGHQQVERHVSCTGFSNDALGNWSGRSCFTSYDWYRGMLCKEGFSWPFMSALNPHPIAVRTCGVPGRPQGTHGLPVGGRCRRACRRTPANVKRSGKWAKWRLEELRARRNRLGRNRVGRYGFARVAGPLRTRFLPRFEPPINSPGDRLPDNGASLLLGRSQHGGRRLQREPIHSTPCGTARRQSTEHRRIARMRRTASSLPTECGREALLAPRPTPPPSTKELAG